MDLDVVANRDVTPEEELARADLEDALGGAQLQVPQGGGYSTLRV
jgi:hypothetical protein